MLQVTGRRGPPRQERVAASAQMNDELLMLPLRVVCSASLFLAGTPVPLSSGGPGCVAISYLLEKCPWEFIQCQPFCWVEVVTDPS